MEYGKIHWKPIDSEAAAREHDAVLGAEKLPTPFQKLTQHQKTLISACILADDHEIAGDILAQAIAEAESDSNFRCAFISLKGADDVGALGRLQYLCRSITARIAAEAAVNSLR